MKKSNITKFSLDNCLIARLLSYFVIISFLFPRGYIEFSLTYKKIFTCAIWVSTLIIWIQFIVNYLKTKKYRIIKKEKILISSYFIYLILITIIKRGFFINGYQKLIVYPSICLFCTFNFRRNPRYFLNCINNVIMMSFLLNQIVSRNFFSKMYKEKKKKTIISISLILYTMLTTDASSSVICCIVLCIFGILYKVKKYYFLTKDSRIYIIGGGILSIIVVGTALFNSEIFHNNISVLNFSGRSFVWSDALTKIAKRPIFGYGIEGILLNVFWNKGDNSLGFNYAHNQNIQNFLDGGIIACALFYIMLINFFKKTYKSLDVEYKFLINSIFICFAMIMIVESTSIYYYMYIYLAIVYSLPKAIKYKEKGEKKNGIDK